MAAAPAVTSPPPKLSVCVPMFNKADAVERCLGTVLAARVENMEVLVFDNGSTDGSTDIVARLAAADPRIRHVRLDHTIMVQESWRMALLHGRGELLKLHSADDELQPDFLTHMLPPFENPAIDFTLCAEQIDATNVPSLDVAGMIRFYNSLNDNCRRLLALTDPAARARHLALTCAGANGVGNIYKVVVRRRCLPLERWQAVTRAYPMPTSYPDWDFLLRLVLNHRGHFVDQVLSRYSITADAPIARRGRDPTLLIADTHQLVLMVLTVLADPTLRHLRAALTPQELQSLHNEALRRLTQTVNLAMSLPPSA